MKGVKGRFTVVVEQGEDGYLISEVVELPGCRTQAKTYDQLMERTREAIIGFLKAMNQEEVTSRFVALQQIEV